MVLVASAFQGMSAQKREPETRRIDVQSAQPDSLTPSPTVPMPRLELPEYIIIGVASIDLQQFEKQSPEEQVLTRSDFRQLVGTAGRETTELAESARKEFMRASSLPFIGNARASFGTYSTPSLDVWFGRRVEQLDYQVSADYYRTSGHTNAADRSRGGIGGTGGFTIPPSQSLAGTRIAMSLAYESDQYRFFGSPHPLTARTIMRTSGAFAVSTSQQSTTSVDVRLEQDEVAISDSSFKVSERISHIYADARIPTSFVPLRVGLRYQASSISRQKPQSSSNLEMFVGTHRFWWRNVFLEGSVRAFVSSGLGSAFTVSPFLLGGYRINDQHLVFASFRPRRELESLSGHIRQNLYLSAQAVIPNRDIKVDVSIGAESEWQPWLRSKLTVQYALMENDPRYVDTSTSGVWLIKYDGRTERTIGKAELFANVTANDYFAVALLVQRVKNSTTRRTVPYVPGAEVTATYTHRFAFGVSVSPGFLMVARRWADEANTNELVSYVLINVEVEYRVLERLDVVVRGDNLANAGYETWKGYRAEPLNIHAGLRYRW